MRNLIFPVSKVFVISTLSASLFFTGCFHTETEPVVKQIALKPNAGFPSAKSLNAKLGRGINFGNALDAPMEGAWGVTLKPEWFQWIADSGFATLRLPVRWSNHSLEVAPYTIDSIFMNRVVWAVDLAIAAKLNVVLDMHHYDSIMVYPENEKARFLSMWHQIATRFAAYPPELILEILNEPREQMTAQKWNQFLALAIDTIRTIQPMRTLMIGTSPWGGLGGLAPLVLPEDSNLIVTVHYYEPHPFTHQGATFEPGSSAWLGTRWRATPAQRGQVDQDIKQIKDWATAKNRPIFLGEFGTYTKVDSISRSLYTEYLTTRFTEAGFSWALWNFSSDFGIMDDSTGAWRPYLMDALIRPGHNAYLDSVLKATTPIDLDKYLVFDDFEDSLDGLPSSASLWQDKIGKPYDSSFSHWYTYFSDSALLTSPSGERLAQWFEVDSGAPRNFAKAVGAWGFQGKGLHVKARLIGSAYPYAGFGAGLLNGWDSSSVDLTQLTAIQFRAKGRGEWCMQVISDSIYNGYPKEDNWGAMNASFVLKDQWESFIFPAEKLVPKKYSVQAEQGITWADVRNKIKALEFMNGQSYGQAPDDSLELWIDDIRLIGVDKASFGL